MADQSSSPQSGATASRAAGIRVTRKQGLLLGVLSAALVGVWFFGQPPVDAEESTSDAGRAGTGRRDAARGGTPSRTDRWPALTIDQVLKTNPFAELALPAAPLPPVEPAVIEPVEEPEPEPEAVANDEAAQDEQKRLAEVVAQLKSQKVKMILRTNGRVSALIGDRMVHEGDLIEGFRIVSIGPTGVFLQSPAAAVQP